jgi:hypothetical protein
MAITINNNTISSSNGTITIPSGKKLYAPGTNKIFVPGRIVNVTHFSNNTRTSLSSSSSTTLWSAGNVFKKVSGSKLVMVGQLCFGDGKSYNMGYWWQIGSSGLRRDSIFMDHYPSDQRASVNLKLGWFINGEYSTSATGNLAVSIGWASIDGNPNWPGSVWNPNTSDDGRAQQHTSDLKIYEVLT